MRTLSDGALIGHDNGCSQGQLPSGAREVVDTGVHAHAIQAEAPFSESRECSSATGAHSLSACGGQGEHVAAARHVIRRDNPPLVLVAPSGRIARQDHPMPPRGHMSTARVSQKGLEPSDDRSGNPRLG